MFKKLGYLYCDFITKKTEVQMEVVLIKADWISKCAFDFQSNLLLLELFLYINLKCFFEHKTTDHRCTFSCYFRIWQNIWPWSSLAVTKIKHFISSILIQFLLQIQLSIKIFIFYTIISRTFKFDHTPSQFIQCNNIYRTKKII